jgi:hypothetical protein
LRNCYCGPTKFDSRNSATLRILLPVPLLSSPFSSAQDGFKINEKYFQNFLCLWKPKTCLKGTVARDFLSPIFFHESTENCGSGALKLRTLSCGLQKNCDWGIAELRLRSNIPFKVVELRLRKFFLQVAELRLRTQKKVPRAHLCAAH